MIYYALTGAGLGIAAGLSPGPLMTLLIAESLRGGFPAGFRVCMAPLITDSLLISLALLLTAPLPGRGLALVSLLGGLVMIWMGWSTMRSQAPVADLALASPRGALFKGVVTNLLNPHAILFWVTIGAPLLRTGLAGFGLAAPLSFMGAFFLVMIGAKLVIAYGISRSRHFLQGAAYRWTLGAAGALLAALGVWRLYEGIVGFS